MNAIGTVIEIENDNIAVVNTQRSSACASCHNCEANGACHAQLIFGEQNSVVTHRVLNSVGAKTGDKVEISASTNKTLMLSALVFVFPLVVVAILYFLLSEIIKDLGLLTVLIVAAYIFVFVVVAKIMNVYARKNIKTYIVRIIGESN